MAEDLKALPGFSRPTQAWAAAEAANEIAALRTDNERLTELNWHGAAVIEELKAISEHKSARIEELEAALDQIRSMSSDYHNLSEIYDRAVTVLLAGEEKEG
jgi:Fic family protein